MHASVRFSETPVSPSAPARLSSTTIIHFDEFYRRELPAMIALARSICGNQELAEDLAQEALTKAHRDWPRIQRYDRPGAWLRRVTINLALSRRRRIVREFAVLARVVSEPLPVATDADPDSMVWEAVRRLPPKQRAAVALFYQEDLTTTAIAEILECSISTATSHLNLARKRLAEFLAEAPPEDLA